MNTDSDPDLLRDIRPRSQENDGIFWLNERQLMVANADAARRVHMANFDGLMLPDRLSDQVRRKASPAVSRKHLRAAMLTRLRTMPEPESTEGLAERMDALLRDRTGQHVDFVWLAHEVIFRSLLPLIIDGLPDRDRAWVTRDAIAKLTRLSISGRPEGESFSQRWHSTVAQLQVGRVVRREIRGRAARHHPPRMDLTQTIVADLLPVLGRDRGMEAITAVLTAVAGPPGATASCVMFELVNRPEWAGRLTGELSSLTAADICRAGVRCAPVTHRFVKEVMRIWTAPLMMTRSVQHPIALPGVTLSVGQQYILSPYLVHHNPRYWPAAEVFDPDRWLAGSANAAAASQYSVPFGWAPTSCIGAGIGMVQQILLCHLLCTRYCLQPSAPERMRIALAAVPLPHDFTGTVVRR